VSGELDRTQQLAVALYGLGYSAQDVSAVLDVSRSMVSELVVRAGIARANADSVRLSRHMSAGRAALSNVPVLCEVVEDLADRTGIPVGLLLAVVADRCATAPGAVQDRPVCAGVCSFGCTHHCARTPTPTPAPGTGVRDR
jgi:transposase